MQLAHICITDHVGHNRKNLDDSNLERVHHHIFFCEQQPSQEMQNREHISVSNINIMVQKGNSLN